MGKNPGRPAWHPKDTAPTSNQWQCDTFKGLRVEGWALVQMDTPKGLNIHPKGPQGSPRSQIFQQPTSLENAQEQVRASAKSEAEMGQREAGRPSNCNTDVKPTANHLQEVIRAIVRKAVATWRHPQAGRPRGGWPAPLCSVSSPGFAWKTSTPTLPACN